MTFVEMVTEAELLYESINSSDAPGFTSTEWGGILTVAQRKVVMRILKDGINKNAFNQLAIEYLVKSDSYLSFVNSSHFKNTDGTWALCLNVTPPIGEAFDSKFFWILDEYVTSSVVSNIPLFRINYDFYRKNLDNPFRTPSIEEGFWILQYNNIPVFITDGTVITGFYIVGVQHPDNFPINSTNDCLLNESIHSEIVKEAVLLARMSVLDTQGYQLALAEFEKN
jgi:hypothetical protein